MEDMPIAVGGLKETFAKHRHGGLDMLKNMLADEKRFHIVVPGVDEVDGFDIPTQINREIYNACSAVARDLRLADTKEIDDKELVKEIKGKIAEREDLEFYVAYLFLTETYEWEEDQTVEYSSVSEPLGKYLLGVIVNRIEKSTELRDFEMVRDVVMRMTVGLPSGFSGTTYFGATEYDDIWQVVDKRRSELVDEYSLKDVFKKFASVNEKVNDYKKSHGVRL